MKKILATLCYVQYENKVLMLHRNKRENDYHKGKYNGLGGKFEDGESPEECAIREVKEESGLTVRNPIFSGFITFPKFDKVNDWYVFVYRFKDFSGEIEENYEGSLEWVEQKNLSNLPLWDGDKIFLKWVFENKLFHAKFN
ncbi:MAG: 8-oxo-dGTP diphosphatase, partial [Candidatus Cloacimonadota bacterium]|nr:8-oxo-dGTP diphosphatase [Candidatus Cloacimonadota bacterium]